MPNRLPTSKTRVCTKCKTRKKLSQFCRNPTVSDGRQSRCKACNAILMRERRAKFGNLRTRISNETRRRKNAEAVFNFMREHGCCDCDEHDPIVLEFDHVNGDKKYAVSTILMYSWKTILAEIAKCVIRCANCHRRKTAKDQNWYAYLGRDHDQDMRDRMDAEGLKYRKPTP